jgi:hypothetical protein
MGSGRAPEWAPLAHKELVRKCHASPLRPLELKKHDHAYVEAGDFNRVNGTKDLALEVAQVGDEPIDPSQNHKARLSYRG